MRVTHFQASIDRKKLKDNELSCTSYSFDSNTNEIDESYYQPIIGILTELLIGKT